MPSRYKKSANKGSERYLMFGPNHIFVALRWDGGRFLGHENVFRWFLNSYKIITGSVKTKKSLVSWKMLEMEFKFSKLVKSIVFRCLRANKTLVTQSITYALRNRQRKHAFVKENEKNM